MGGEKNTVKIIDLDLSLLLLLFLYTILIISIYVQKKREEKTKIKKIKFLDYYFKIDLSTRARRSFYFLFFVFFSPIINRAIITPAIQTVIMEVFPVKIIIKFIHNKNIIDSSRCKIDINLLYIF